MSPNHQVVSRHLTIAHSFASSDLPLSMGLPLCPDYIKDHLPKVHQHTAYVGEKRPALEKTGDLRYLWRSAPNRSLPAKYKHQYVGGIGWGIPEYICINRSRLESGFQNQLGELSLHAIDKLTHRYQNPCSRCVKLWGKSKYWALVYIQMPEGTGQMRDIIVSSLWICGGGAWRRGTKVSGKQGSCECFS
ncbi:Gm17359 [Phodopus roborovskii]|uniref:Gm17359 protein n=1 Tax=Phodopus roborovskii TaxID=109678 RepID=A0AAU9ZV71_PHORO|nr:Gm17359 [Phodopus roborovskii]